MLKSILALCCFANLSAGKLDEDAAAENAAIVDAVHAAEVQVATILGIEHPLFRSFIVDSSHGLVSMDTLISLASAPGWVDETAGARAKLWVAWGELLQAHRLFDANGQCETFAGPRDTRTLRWHTSVYICTHT